MFSLTVENGTVIGNTGPQGTVSQWDEWNLSGSSNWYDSQTLQPVAITNFYTQTVVAVFLGAGSPTNPSGATVGVYLDNLTIDVDGVGAPEYTLNDDTGTIEVLCGTFCGITGCTGIQVGIGAALPGDTINVVTGTYTEQINIEKSLTITGSGTNDCNIVCPTVSTMTLYATYSAHDIPGITQYGRYSGHRGANIPIVRIAASDVTFQGFHINFNNVNLRDQLPVGVNAYSRGVGILVDHVESTPGDPATVITYTGVTIQNNLIDGMLEDTDHVGIKAMGKATVSVLNNTIYGYGESTISAQGVDAPVRAAYYPTVTANNNTIYGGSFDRSNFYFMGIGYWSGGIGSADGNTIYNAGPDDYGNALNSWTPNPVSFTNNVVTTDGGTTRGQSQFYESSNLQVTGNTFTNQGLAGAIWSNPTVTINNNTITNCTDGFIGDGLDSGSVTLHCNDFSGTAGGHYALDMAGHDGSIWGSADPCTITADATNNWWGNATGPAGAGPGSGDAVSTNVDYDPWLTAAPPCEVESSNATGATWNTFQMGDSVYIYGSGYPASTSYNISVVVDTTWADGILIPTGEVGTATIVYTDSTGAIAYSNIEGSGTSPALIWTSAVDGDYDIVVDVNGNGYYDSCMDALDDKDVGDAGFNTSPKDCTPEIEVNKTVWDPVTGNWVEEITANVNDTVRFKIRIQNNGTCCNLSGIVVNDTLSESLEYADNATVNGLPCEPEEIVTAGNSTVVRWFYNASRSCTYPFNESLEYCQNITIEFDACKILGTVDTNCANVSAWCDSVPPAWVFDEDCVTVNPTPTLNITLNPDDAVTLNWTSTCTLFDIHITENLTAGFAAEPNATVSAMSWTDVDAPSYAMRYYKVACNGTGEQIDGEVCKIMYELKKGAIYGVNWITLPNTNPPITGADAMIKSIPGITHITGDNVKWWNFTSQQAESYFKKPVGHGGINFPVKPARGYEVSIGVNTTWVVVGWVPPKCQIELKKGAIYGVNWIGMPFDTTTDDADAMIKSIPGITHITGDNVKWWNFTSQQAESYFKKPVGHGGINFPVKPARGYEVSIGVNTTWTPQ